VSRTSPWPTRRPAAPSRGNGRKTAWHENSRASPFLKTESKKSKGRSHCWERPC
jgi:hypothetical protein